MGRVKLGPLNGIQEVHASVDVNDMRFGEAWYIMNERDQWMTHDTMNIIAGESIEIPINYDGPTDALSTYRLSLKKMNGTKLQTLANLSSSIKIQKSRMGTYNIINLKDLEVGFYILKLNMTPSQKQFLHINVH